MGHKAKQDLSDKIFGKMLRFIENTPGINHYLMMNRMHVAEDLVYNLSQKSTTSTEGVAAVKTKEMKVSIFIATSLDGFTARTNGNIDWLIAADEQDSPEDYGYQEFYDSIDCLIMGRNSMEKVINFPEWPYEDKRVIILSNTLEEVPAQHVDKFELYSGSLTELVKRLEIDGFESLYIDGGKTIQSFINNDLVTDITITTIPILLGDGLPLFGKIKKDIKLTHIETKSYPNGFVKSTYEI